MALSPQIIHSLPITSLSHDGRGIGFLKGDSKRLVVFVTGAIPGQTVSCLVEKNKKSFLETKLLDVESPSFIKPLCPQQRECGGCPLQLMPYNEQLLWKEKLAQDSLTRIGKWQHLEGIWQKPLPSPHTLHYRNKVTLAFGEDSSGNLILGFRQRLSHIIQPVQSCALIEEQACEILKACLLLAKDVKKNTHFWQSLILRKSLAPDLTPVWTAICQTQSGSKKDHALLAALGRQLLALSPMLYAFIHEEKDRIGKIKRVICLNKAGEADPNAAILRMRIGKRIFALDAGSFFQINNDAAELLANLAIAFAPPTGTGLLDLYCGVGTPGILLAQAFKYALGIEADKISANYANENGKDCNYKALGGKSSLLLSSRLINRDWTTLLLDPPRAGLEERVLKKILEILPANIIYISCNPVTFARDSVSLSKKYQLSHVASVDMFPHTQHLELCSYWKKI